MIQPMAASACRARRNALLAVFALLAILPATGCAQSWLRPAPPVSTVVPRVADDETTSPLDDKAVAGVQAEGLAARLRRRLETIDWEGGKVSFLVQDAQLPLTVFELNADIPAPPGTLAQILTAGAAFAGLGPDFRFTTQLIAIGPDLEHRSAAALIVRGDGDPTLSLRYLKTPAELWKPFDEWVKALKSRKILSIDGPLVGDDTLFDGIAQAPGWPEDRAGDAKLPNVSALNFNHNCIDIAWRGRARPGNPATFAVFPDFKDFIFFSSDVQVAAAERRGRHYQRVKDGNLIVATGDIAYQATAAEHAAIQSPTRFFLEALRDRLTRGGIKIGGSVLPKREMPPAESLGSEEAPLDVRFSPPLTEIVGHMFRDDETLEAETIFKALGRKFKNNAEPGSFINGSAAVQAWLDSLRAPGPFASIADGSGQSMVDRLSARQLLFALRGARQAAGGAEVFDPLLPRAGSEGALEARFKSMKGEEAIDDAESSAPAGGGPPSIWMKASSQDGFEGGVGRVETRWGRRLDFAVMVNGSRTPPQILRRQIDLLIMDLAK